MDGNTWQYYASVGSVQVREKCPDHLKHSMTVALTDYSIPSKLSSYRLEQLKEQSLYLRKTKSQECLTYAHVLYKT